MLWESLGGAANDMGDRADSTNRSPAPQRGENAGVIWENPTRAGPPLRALICSVRLLGYLQRENHLLSSQRQWNPMSKYSKPGVWNVQLPGPP